jgi:hypothetical protein
VVARLVEMPCTQGYESDKYHRDRRLGSLGDVDDAGGH